MDVIKREDEWYWSTYAGWNAFQCYYFENIGEENTYTLYGRYATEHAFVLYVWLDGEWHSVGTTGSATPFAFDVTDYVEDGILTVLCDYNYQAYAYIDTSFVHIGSP